MEKALQKGLPLYLTNGLTIQTFTWWNSMINEERLITNSGINKQYSDYLAEDWIVIINYVISKLNEYFGEIFIYNNDDFSNVGKGFCIEFKSKSCHGPMNMRLEGTLGADILGDNEDLRISATLFAYSNDRRLITNDNDSFFQIEYKSSASGGKWVSLGWMFDEYNEY
jgi:hypothetical protein